MEESEEMRKLEEMREFVEKLSEEMDGKQVGEVLPIDISMITSVCLTRLFSHTPSALMMKHDLMNMATLIANSVLKYQEHKIEEAQALDGLWKES